MKNYTGRIAICMQIPGSKAVYYKIINSEGKTVRAYKETYDPSGN